MTAINTPDAVKALAQQIAVILREGREEAALMEQVQEINATLHTIQITLADGDRRMETMEKRDADQSARLAVLEKQVTAAGLEDIAGVKKFIFRLGLVALVALCGLLAGVVILAPHLAKIAGVK